MSWETIMLLFFAGLSAGFIDAIAGGGGLISVPALLWAGLPPQMALGTNKMQSTWGTLMAVRKYAKAGLVSWPQVRLTVLITFVSAMSGAWVVMSISNAVLKMIVPWMLLCIAVYVLLSPSLGKTAAKARLRMGAFACLAGSVLGFYDGFFGPGTGSFLLFGFVRFFGFDFLHASAATKLVNVATNLAAILMLASLGQINWPLGFAMMIANIAGSQFGSRLAIKHGSAFVRKAFLLIVSVLILKSAWNAYFIN